MTSDLLFYEILIPLLLLVPPDLFLSWYLYHSPTRSLSYAQSMRLDTQLLSLATSLYTLLEGGYLVLFKLADGEYAAADEVTREFQEVNVVRWAVQAVGMVMHAAYVMIIVQKS